MKNKKRNLNDNNYLDGIIAETLGLPIEMISEIPPNIMELSRQHFWDLRAQTSMRLALQ